MEVVVEPAPVSKMIEGEEEYEVERILDHRWFPIRKGRRTVHEKQFKVRWAGYAPTVTQSTTQNNCESDERVGHGATENGP
jgi:hypothetical protein